MNNLIIHRGPDNQSIYNDKNFGFGHCRLSIIDLTKKANQPFHSDDNRFLIIYNGEVYNYLELKNKLVNALIITDTDSMKNIDKSARNIKNIKLIKEEGTNIYDLFKYKNVIITSSSAKKIQQRVLNEKN